MQFDQGQSLEQLQLLSLKPQKRKNILRSVIRSVNRASKDRITKQKDLAGKSWQGRANGKKKKMLTKLKRHLKVRARANDAQVYLKGARVGKIATAHQTGATIDVNPRKGGGKRNSDGMATRPMAKALIRAGYTIPRNRGKGSKRPSIKWIVANITLKQAGFLLRELKGGSGKSEWQIDLPARSFLGETPKEHKQHMSFMLNKAMQVA
ncbi:phage virion morphogenesis protein [Pseudoalteromonas sp. S16_S37]|uniref:phage virion morphogenesis protein n=1 Tax=Pseudoalteromonas sp. S16_S37 TaxID=2720228 RepID=UPI00188A9D7F|nr:phage virion morphogenesis protein [Pseudoalteromonas sp. S16_S37]